MGVPDLWRACGAAFGGRAGLRADGGGSVQTGGEIRDVCAGIGGVLPCGRWKEGSKASDAAGIWETVGKGDSGRGGDFGEVFAGGRGPGRGTYSAII